MTRAIDSRTENRLRRMNLRIDLLAKAVGVDLDELEDAHKAGVAHDMPSTWSEYQAYVRRLADEVES